MSFELSSPLLDYDPEEEERKRIAALAALAASATPDHEAFSPGELDSTSTLTAPTRTVELPQVDIIATPEGVQRSNDLVSEFGADPEPDPVPAAAAALASAGKPAPPPQAAPPPAMSAEPPPPAQQDPFEALMRRGEEQRQRALEMYGDSEPGVNGWALLADVAFNKGKSIPGILQQADNDKRAWRDGRAKLLTGGHGDPVNQAIALGNLRARQATGERLSDKDQRAVEQDANARNAFMTSWDKWLSPEQKEALANAPASTFRTLAGQIRDQIKNSPEYQKQHAAGVALDTEARVSTTNETNARQAPLLETAAHARGAGHFGAQAEAAPGMPQKPGEIRDDERAEESLRLQRQTAENAALDRKERARIHGEEKAVQHENAFTKSIDRARPLALELQSVEDIIADYKSRGEAVPGIGPQGTEGSAAMRVGTSSLTPEWIRGLVGSVPGVTGEEATKTAVATKVRGLIENFARDNIHNRSGAAFNMNEEQINAILSGAAAGASLEQVETALQTMHMLVEGQISAAASPIPDIAAKNLKNSGIDPMRFGGTRWLGQQSTQPLAANPELAPGQSLVTNEEGDEVVEGAGVEPDPRDATPNLGKTSGRLPKANEASGGGTSRVVTVVLPSGKRVKRSLSEADIARLRQKGATIE